MALTAALEQRRRRRDAAGSTGAPTAVTSLPTPTPASIIAVAVDTDVQGEPVRHSPLCTSKVPHPAGFRGGPPMLISVSHPVFAIATPFGSTPAIILARPS